MQYKFYSSEIINSIAIIIKDAIANLLHVTIDYNNLLIQYL